MILYVLFSLATLTGAVSLGVISGLWSADYIASAIVDTASEYHQVKAVR